MRCPACSADLPDNAVFCPRCGERIEGASECEDYTYEAFISYRHLPLDTKAAIKVQRAIEGYRIPKQLVGDAGREKLGKCFRDEDELPTSASLTEQIEDALRHARYLVVIATPHTRESLWVTREVETFASYHGRDKIIVALAEGEPSESFPELLLTTTCVDADGTVRTVPAEPIAADLRDLSRKKFSVESLRIIASLIGCNFDDLRQRARLRRNRIVAAITSAVAVVSTAFGGYASYQQHQIEQSYRQIQIEQSEFLARESGELLASGDRYQAVQVALDALPLASVSEDRPYVPAAQLALEQALGVYPGSDDWIALYSQIGFREFLNSPFVFDGSGIEASSSTDRFIEIRATATNDLICRFDAESALVRDQSFTSSDVALGFSAAGVVTVYEDVAGCFDPQTGELIWRLPLAGLSRRDVSLAISSDGALIALETEEVGSEKVLVHLVDAASGSVEKVFELPGSVQMERDSSTSWAENPVLMFSPDGTSLAVGRWGTLFLIDLETGDYRQAKLHFDSAASIVFAADRICVFSQDDSASWSAKPTSLEVFDMSLNRLWSREEEPHPGFTADGDQYVGTLGVFGTWDYYGDGSEQLIVSFKDRLLLLDAQTGEQVWELATTSSIMDCLVAEVCGYPRIFATMGDGTAVIRRPLESNSGRGGTVGDAQLLEGLLMGFDLFESDGRVYCSAYTSYPAKRMVFCFASTDEYLDDRPFDDRADAPGYATVFRCDDTFAALSDSTVVFMDPATLERTVEVPLADLALLDPEQYGDIEAVMGPDNCLFVLGKATSETSGRDGRSSWAIYRVSGEDGSASLIAQPANMYRAKQFGYESTADGSGLLILVTSEPERNVVIFDASAEAPQEAVASYSVLHAENAWPSGTTIIVSSNEGTFRAFTLIDRETDEAIECDLAGYTFASSSSADLSADGLLFAAICSDGALRCFDSVTGTLVWETDQIPPLVQYMRFGSGANLLVQDAFGRCLLVSGLTGEILGATSTLLPPLKGSMRLSDGDMLLARFANVGMLGKYGMVLISLDEGTFGPTSMIYNASAISADGSAFLYYNSFDSKLHVARYLSLDELIALGHEMCAGHELSASERQLYQVGEAAPVPAP